MQVNAVLNNCDANEVKLNGRLKKSVLCLTSGEYLIEYKLASVKLNKLSINSTVRDILEDKNLSQKVDNIDNKILQKMKKGGNTYFLYRDRPFKELLVHEKLSEEIVQKINLLF